MKFTIFFVTHPTQFQDLYENSMILHRCADNSTANVSAFTSGVRKINVATLQDSYMKPIKKPKFYIFLSHLPLNSRTCMENQ